MLKKTNRLAKTTDIHTAFAKGRNFFNPYFNIKYLPKVEGLRFTVVVSTKVFKKAVARNRLKRIIREHVRKNLNGFKKGDYVVMAKPKISNQAENKYLEYFLDAMARINYIRR